MSLKTLERDEVLYDPTGGSSAEIYLIAEGKVKLSKFHPSEQYKEEQEVIEKKTDSLSHKINSQKFTAGQLFGDLSALGFEQFGGLYAYAFDGSAEVIVIDKNKVREKYDDLN